MSYPSAFLAAMFCLLSLSAPVDSVAAPEPQNGEVALELGHDGLTHFSEGRFAEALEAFGRAEALMHSPVFVLYQARASKELGELFRSRGYYQALVDEQPSATDPDAWTRARADARRELRELSLLIPELHVSLQGEFVLPVTIEIGGRQLVTTEPETAVEADPGLFALRFKDARGTVVENYWAAKRGDRSRELAVHFPAVVSRVPYPVVPEGPISPEGQGRGPLFAGAVTAFSASGAAFVAAGIFVGLSVAKASEIKKNCAGSSCLPEDEPKADTARRYANLATAGVVVGAVGAVAGVSLLLLDRKESKATRELAAVAHFDGIHLRATF